MTACFLAGILALGFAASAGAKTTHHKSKSVHHATTTTTKPKPKPKPLPTPHIGQVAKDGKFAFTVTSVQCGVTTLGSGYLTKAAPAGSSWCLATMTVKAYQSQAQSFFASNQYAVDKKGRQLSADDDDALYIPQDQNVEGENINPGISITAVVPFQVATGDTIAKFVLHDSAFSGGVTVYNLG
jgi:hypothetical protein